MLEFARLGLGTIKRKEIVEQPKRQSMPPYQFARPLLALGKQFDGLALEAEPPVFGQVFNDTIAILDAAVLHDLVQSQPSLFPQSPDDLEQFVLFLDLRQDTQGGMAGFSLDDL